MRGNLPSNIQAIVIYQAVQIVETGDVAAINNLIEMGFSPENLDKLRHLPTMEVARMLSDDMPLVHVTVNSERIDQAFQAIATSKKDAEMQDEFIRRGASASMMHQLFRMSRKQVSAQRALLCVAQEDGRPRLPPDEMQHAVYRAWRKLKQIPIRQRYLNLHDSFPDVTLAVLYALVGMDRD